MLEIRITAPELAEAINNLARAMTVRAETTQNGMTAGAVPTNTTSAVANENIPAQAAAQAPTQQNTVPVAPPAPTAVAPTTVVPTAAPQYTLDMIAKAGTALIDAGKMNELTALLAKFGVNTLTALAPSYYPAFVTELRSLGAQI